MFYSVSSQNLRVFIESVLKSVLCSAEAVQGCGLYRAPPPRCVLSSYSHSDSTQWLLKYPCPLLLDSYPPLPVLCAVECVNLVFNHPVLCAVNLVFNHPVLCAVNLVFNHPVLRAVCCVLCALLCAVCCVLSCGP